MINLDYGTQLSFTPIKLSIGTIKKPQLKDIAEISFDRFAVFQAFIKMTPEAYYLVYKGEEGKEQWKNMSEEEKLSITLFDLILQEDNVRNIYTELFNFFFAEHVVYRENVFLILNEYYEKNSKITQDAIRGIIHKDILLDILDILQQICCLRKTEEKIDDKMFKNKRAKKLYEKMLKRRSQLPSKTNNKDLELPNIISAVSSKHPSINLTNVWELTIFQLIDTFNRLQADSAFYIDSVRVSVWGDEKKTFNMALWYKNQFSTND